MAGVRELKRRIKSIQKTKQITRAMKMVATVRYKRALETLNGAKSYLSEIENLRSRVWTLPIVLKHPLFEKRKVERLGIVIVGSDKGLCGSFNSNIFRLSLKRIAQEIESGKSVELITVGRKTRDFFKRMPYPIAESYLNIPSSMEQAFAMNQEWSGWFTGGRFDEIIVMYNQFKNVMQCIPIGSTLYPLAAHVEKMDEPFDALHEPTMDLLANYIIKKVPETAVYRMLIESTASEQGIRMTMMDQATRKADDLTRELTIHMNKARQTGITTELIEMTAAAEALR